MGRQQLFAAFIGLLAVENGVVHSQIRPDQPQHYSDGIVFPQLAPLGNSHGQRKNIDIVEGTIDQSNRLDDKWVCTHRETGAQMVFGNEFENVIHTGYQHQNSQTYPVRSGPGSDSSQNPPPNQGFVTASPIDEEGPIFLRPTTIEEVRKKWADFDWTQYITGDSRTSAPTSASTSAPTWAPTTAPREDSPYGGEGIIEIRIDD